MRHNSTILLGLLFMGAACSQTASDPPKGGSPDVTPQWFDGTRGGAGGATDTGGELEALDQPGAPCHPNVLADADLATMRLRGDLASLPAPLLQRLLRIGARPHSALPTQAYAEADGPSQLFQYYLLDMKGFERNVFTTTFVGINDKAQKTATGGNCGLPTVGAVRLVVEPKVGLPVDPHDVRAFIDVFTDISGLFVINNESGWYEGWMIHDLVIPAVAPPRAGIETRKHPSLVPAGQAQFGMITEEDARVLEKMGTGHNVPGATFTVDGRSVRLPSEKDHFPKVQTNIVPIQLSMGAYNALQQMDIHAYWEFNYTTNWVHPLYELPYTGGLPDAIGQPPDAFEDGEIGFLSTIVPGSGPLGVKNKANKYGDNPFLPRDPDKFDADDADEQRELRMRFIPSGLANEIMLDIYVRLASFMPHERSLNNRLFAAYAHEVARIDTDGDGVVSAVEGDVDGASDGFDDNSRLFLPATEFRRFAVTREINDGYLAPRFAPSQRAWLLTGALNTVSPAVAASQGRDGDDRLRIQIDLARVANSTRHTREVEPNRVAKSDERILSPGSFAEVGVCRAQA